MEPLMTTKLVLTWLSVCPAAESASKFNKMAYTLFTVANYVAHLSGVLTHLAYFLKYSSTDLEGSIFAFMGTTTYVGMVYITASLSLQRDQISQIFRKLSTIYELHKNVEEFEFLLPATNTSEWIWAILIKIVKIVVGGNVFFCFISSMIGFIIKGHYDPSYLFHLSKIVVPWDKTTLLGYYGEIAFTLYWGLACWLVSGVILLLFVSICIHHQAFYRIFEHSIDKWNHCAANRNDEQFVFDRIRFHILINDWLWDTVKVYSPFILIQLVSSAIMLATSMFYLDLQFEHINISLCVIASLTAMAMSILFIFCYFGRIATDSFASISDCVYFDMQWQKLSTKQQAYVVLMIRIMQKPIYYHGFGVVIMNLNTFTLLCRNVVTYFMMFKTIAS